MQNLVTLLGSTNAAIFTALMASNYRWPAQKLLALNEDGTTYLDLSPYLLKASFTQNDEMIAQQGTFTIASANGIFDKFGSGAYHLAFDANRILVFTKGLKDAAGNVYLLPAYYGRATHVGGTYKRGDVPAFDVICLDPLKNPLKQKVTTQDYRNTEVNLIAADVAARYCGFPAGRQKFYAVSYPYADAQFPDYVAADILKRLYEPLMFGVKADESGNLVTTPRLGSGLYGPGGTSNILGYPDALTPPPSAAVAYTIPDAVVLEISPTWQDHEFVNQIRVLGSAANAIESLGPVQTLHTEADSSVASDGRLDFQCYFGAHSDGSNSVVCQSPVINFQYSTTHQLDSMPQLVTIGPFATQAQALSYGYAIKNSDGKEVMFIAIIAYTPTYLTLKITGTQYSSGSFPTRHHGGGDFNFTITGAPLVSTSKVLTSIKDYNPTLVAATDADGLGVDIFSDHQTFQFPYAPLAMGTPTELFIGGVSQGINSADQQNVSLNYKVDWERGRAVLQNLTYRVFVSDNGSNLPSGAAFPTVTGGGASTNTIAWAVNALDTPTPVAVYQSNRYGESQYVFGGLNVGQGYDLRLHFGDDSSNQGWDGSSHSSPSSGQHQRVFDVYANGQQVLSDVDIFTLGGGSNKAVQQYVSGITPDFAGNITVQFLAHDPVTWAAFHPNGSGGGGPWTSSSRQPTDFIPIVSGIEIILPQGQGADPYAVNSGGPVINPTPPVVTMRYGWSPVQQIYGINNLEVNNPLISTQATCDSVAQFYINYSAWARNQVVLRTASLPHLQAGDLIKFYSPKINSDLWAYIESLTRDGSRQTKVDEDTFNNYLLYAQPRS